MRNLLISISFILLCVDQATGQDIHFSQFLYNPLQRGAAEAGNFDGDIRFSAMHRRQWKSVSAPYKTFSFSGDGKLSALNSKLRGLNAGIIISRDAAGDGNLSILNASFSVAYSIRIDADSVHYLRGGIEAGFGQRSVDFQKFNFDNQFNGDVFNPSASTGETPSSTSVTYPDIGISGGWTGHFTGYTLDAGVHYAHLNKPGLSFSDNASQKLSPLFQATVFAVIDNKNKIYWIPAITLLAQRKYSELAGGLEAVIRVNQQAVSRTSLGASLFFRNADAVIPGIALYYNKFRIGFTYDINFSGLVPASNYRGGPEISLVYIARKIVAIDHGRRTCPVY